MRSAKILAVLIGCALAAGAAAETVVVDGHVRVAPSPVATPVRGTTMHAVQAKFGAPSKRYPTVGKPPITRWDYPAFSVFFEYNRVVDSVAHG